MNRVIMLNTPELPVIGTLYFQVMKFMSAFKVHGYVSVEVRTLDELLAMNPEAGDFVYVSDHGLSRNETEVIRAFEKVRNLECIFIMWFYHHHIHRLPMPKRWILTGEHFRNPPKVKEHLAVWNIQKDLNNYVPMTFATAILPDNIGRYRRNEVLRASFVGAPYQVEWCQNLVSTGNDVVVKYTPPFISEEDRFAIYLSSVVSLGFHSENNALNSVLVERVFEGLALGNVVVSDNPACEEFTDGNVKLVSSLEEVKWQIDRVWSDVTERRERQRSGMEWCRKNGTYVNVTMSFIEKSRELWGL